MSQLFPDNVEPKRLDPAWEPVSCAKPEGDMELALWHMKGIPKTASRDKS